MKDQPAGMTLEKDSLAKGFRDAFSAGVNDPSCCNRAFCVKFIFDAN